MNEPQIKIYEFDEFRVDVAKRLLTKGDGEEIPLTPKVFDTLLYLVRHGGRVIEKDELMREIWTDSIVEENNLTQNISILRRVFGEKPGEHRFIVTIAGHGYRFVPAAKPIWDSGFGTSDLGFGIADLRFENENQKPKTEDRKPSEELKTEDQTAINDAQRLTDTDEIPNPKSKIPNQTWFVAVAVLSVLAIGAVAGFYWWRESSKSASAIAPIKTIAVLPFKPLVAGNRNEALELGIADALISNLSGGDGEIIAHSVSSVRRFNNLDQDALAAGRELGVDSVLEGNIQTAGDRIRISARLLRVSDGAHLWAEQFDEKFTDIFAVQDSISERVAAALKIRLGRSQRKKRQTENIEAYQLYMKGRFHILKAVRSEIETGISYFEQAIAADPGYALAYAGLADAYRASAVGGEMPSAEFMPKAKAAALRAIELNDTLSEAHTNLGQVSFWYDWDWNAAEKQHKRALELDPNSADTHQFYAHLLSNTGRHAEALAEIKRARELDPLNLRINALEGMFLLHAGQTDEAVAKLRKTLELDANYRLAVMFSARAYSEKGMFAAAVAATRKAREISAISSEPLAFGAYALAKSGKVAEARAALVEMLELSQTRWVPPYNFALVYNALGESDKALDYLEKAFAEKDVRMVFLKVEPKWNNLRNQPRFVDLMRRMNFE